MAAKAQKAEIEPEDALQSVTGVSLSPNQLQGIECLVSREPGETISVVAERAGVTRQSIWRWMQSADFVSELRKRVEDELGSQRAVVAAALVRGAITPGPGQAAMQKIFWQRLGELTERHELTGEDGGPIEVDLCLLEEPLLRKIHATLTNGNGTGRKGLKE